MTKLILDATSLICWADELCDDILFQKLQELEHEFIVPRRVIDEVNFDELKRPDIAKLVKKNVDIREVSDKKHGKLSNRYLGLGDGELSAIAIAQTLDNIEEIYCVLDDKSARNTCEKLGISKKGQIGLVAELIKEGKISEKEGRNILTEMKEGGTILPENYVELLQNNI